MDYNRCKCDQITPPKLKKAVKIRRLMATNDHNLPLDQVLVGDCRQILAGLPEDSIDLIFADPSL